MDYRRNEDKWCDQGGCNYNHIWLVEDISEESGSAGEPVTLQEVKDYIRAEGFQADDDSPADEFTFDDDLLDAMIIEARMWVEKQTGVHLVNKHLQVVLSNGDGMSELPGPVTGAITVMDSEGAVLTDVAYFGTLFPKLRRPNLDKMILTYWAGYNGDAPKWARNSIKAYVAWAYEHRGDETDAKGTPDRAAQICRPHNRLPKFG